MATILVHAGMPKTGSTSVQSWLVKNSEQLRDHADVFVLVASSPTPQNPTVRLEPYESGRINSGPVIATWSGGGQSPEIARRFIDDLAGFAEQHPFVLVTAEALAEPFWRVDPTFLDGFEQLARAHDVRVAYYVRPQHSAIEAGWREGGYKQKREPSRYVCEFAKRLHYRQTADAVGAYAPNIAFTVRPFRADLLDGGSPVQDFVGRFLSFGDVQTDAHANPGLPLQLVNMLRYAPEGWFWSRGTQTETYPRRQLRKVFEDLEIEESPKIQRSRLILQQYCHEVFELENQQLARRLDWATDSFVPSAVGLAAGWDIGELDRLWVPDASDVEREFFYWALRTALDEATR
ncbi:MAG: hypothetical protein ACRDWD_16780 [Acidimicrobiia bacterium]